MAISLVGLDTGLANVIQDGTIEKIIHEALVSETLFRSAAQAEQWTPREGETLLMTRSGLIPVSINPLTPNVDPTPQTFQRETWRATLDAWGSTVDVYLPNDYVSVVPEFLDKSQKIGINCGETLDRVVRSRLFRAYLGGNTVAFAAAAIGATQIHVASLNGFREINDADGLPVAVSATNPLTISFGGAEPNNTVTAFNPDDVNAPFGPGFITLGAALTVGVAAREAVLAANRSSIVIAGGGNSVDAIGAADTLSFADLISAVTQLRASPTVPPLTNGLYHCHLSPYAEGQLLQDAAVRGLLQAPTFPVPYAQYSLGILGGCIHYRNARSPDSLNTGTLVSSGAGASFCSPEIGGEVINNGGIRIGYTLICGQGSIYEKYVPPFAVQDSLGQNQISSMQNVVASNGTVMLNAERAKMIIRPPQDRNNERAAITWNFKGDFPIPSDITTSTSRYIRAIAIAHAIG